MYLHPASPMQAPQLFLMMKYPPPSPGGAEGIFLASSELSTYPTI